MGDCWYWKPQKDITTWELAQAMRAFLKPEVIVVLPQEVKRHFALMVTEVDKPKANRVARFWDWMFG